MREKYGGLGICVHILCVFTDKPVSYKKQHYIIVLFISIYLSLYMPVYYRFFSTEKKDYKSGTHAKITLFQYYLFFTQNCMHSINIYNKR